MKSIYLIDDQEIANYINELTIKSLGMFGAIDVFLFAREALAKLTALAAAGQAGPNIILLDLNMKPMSGFAFLDECSLLPAAFLKKIHVLVLTSSLNERDRIKAQSYGIVSGFLSKPLAAETVLEQLARLQPA